MSEPLKGGFAGFAGGSAFKPLGATGTTGATPNLFGSATPAANAGAPTPAAGTPNAFGGGGNLFGAKPANNALFGGGAAAGTTGTNPAPVSAFGGGSNLFGAKPAESTANISTPTNPPPAFGGDNLFGTKPAETAAATPAGAGATPAPAFGGGLFGAKPAAPNPAAATPATTSTPVPGGSLFGGDKTTPAGTPVATTTTTPVVPSLFGAKKDDAADKDKPATGAAPLGTGLFGAKPAENKDGEKRDNAATTPSPFGATATAAPSTTPNLSVPPPSMLRGKTIEEIVNKWSTDLETHVKEFSRLAGEIAVWDRTLIDNGNTIAALLQHVLLAEREQADIEQSLKHVEDQQKELASTLEVYEKAAGEIFDGQGSGLRALDVGPADAERDKHYTLATDLNANLDDLQRSLMQIIESVNELSESPEDAVEGTQSKGDNPLEQIAQILSSHLESLQWVDGAVREVDSKVTEVERLIKEASSGSRISGNSPFSNSVGPNGSTKSRGFGFR